MGPDAFLHFLDKLLPERCKICIDGLQAVPVLVSQCDIKRCTLAADRCKGCLHFGCVNIVLVKNPDHAVCPLDVQVEFLEPVLVVVCSEMIL